MFGIQCSTCGFSTRWHVQPQPMGRDSRLGLLPKTLLSGCYNIVTYRAQILLNEEVYLQVEEGETLESQ